MKLTRGKKIAISLFAVLIVIAIIITTVTIVLSYKFDVRDTASRIEEEAKVNLAETTLKEAVAKMENKYVGYGDNKSDYWHFYIYGTKEQISKINIDDEEYVKYSYTIMELSDDIDSDIIGHIICITDNRSYSGKTVDTTRYPIYVHAFSLISKWKKAEIDRNKLDYFALMLHYSGRNGEEKVCFVLDNKLVGVASITTEVASVKYQGEVLKVPVIKYHYSNFVESKNGGMVKSVKIGSDFMTENSIRPIYEDNKVYIPDDEVGYKIIAVTPTVYRDVSENLFFDTMSGYDIMRFDVNTDIEQYHLTAYYVEILNTYQDANHVNKIAAADIVVEINGREYGVGLHYEGVVNIA